MLLIFFVSWIFWFQTNIYFTQPSFSITSRCESAFEMSLVSKVFSDQFRKRSNFQKKTTNSSLNVSVLNFFSHNTRGLTKDEHIEECLQWTHERKSYATCLQETWMVGDQTYTFHNNQIMINHGPTVKLCKRGSLGVSIVLSSQAAQDWKAAGSQILYFGCRILAIRLSIKSDDRSNFTKIFLVSAYAPIGAASPQIRAEYQSNMQACVAACGKHEILIIGSDTNSSAGIRDVNDNQYVHGRDQVRGPFGLKYHNKSGQELVNFLAINELCLPNTFFKKKFYGTWLNPQSKLQHQLDHFIIKRKDLHRINDGGHYGVLSKDSDHSPILLKVKIGFRTIRLKEENIRINKSLLKNPEVACDFANKTKQFWESDPKLDKPAETLLLRLENSLKKAAVSTLSTSERKQPGWYEMSKDIIQPLIVKRNGAQTQYNLNPTNKTLVMKLRIARKTVKYAIRQAETTWLNSLIVNINMDGIGANGRPRDPKAII